MSEVITNSATTSTVKTDVVFNPFPGLRPFTIDESHLFFGREGQSDEVLRKLGENRFVGVIGASGSGKSSLMYCGLIPVLYGGFITEAGSKWKIVTTRPGRGPIDNLATALVESELDESDSSTKEEIQVKSAIASTVLRSSSLGLIESIKQLKKDKDDNVLILVDQFEELFRFKRSKKDSSTVNESVAFVKLLLEAIKQSEVPIYVVLTMRSDFIGDCAQFPSLTKLINDSHYLIPQMTREDMRDAIVGPVAVGGGEISSQLVQQLLNDVGDNQDQLPILQHAMMRTWDFWMKNREDSEPLDVHHYESIGKLVKALSLHANESFDELSDRQKEVCESVFKALTEKGADNRGIRHPTSIDDLAQISRATESEVIEIVDNFRKAGRSFISPSYEVEISKNSVVDISHESLMRIWDRLKSWVEEEANSVQMYLRLSEASAMYQLGKTGLWRPPDLQLAVNWREKQKPTLTWAKRYDPAYERAIVFLETSEKAHETEEQNKIRLQKRALKRSRVFAIVLGTLTIISLGAFLFALVQMQQANDDREAAEVAQQEAVAEKAKSDKLREQAEKAEAAALKDREKALEAKAEAEKQTAEAEKQTAIAVLARKEADQQKVVALQALKKAEKATLEALTQKELANEATKEAISAKEDAQKQRMLSVAQSMAVRSTTIRRDTTERALVALGSYNITKEYTGEENSNTPDVHKALYEATYYLNGDDFNQLKGHKGNIQSIEHSHNGNTLLSSSSDGKILKWNANSPQSSPTLVFEQYGYTPRKIAMSDNDGNVLVIANNAQGLSSVDVVDINSPGQQQKLSGHNGLVWTGVFINDNEVITSGSDSTIRLWNVGDGSNKVIHRTNSNVKEIVSVGESIFIANDAGQVKKLTKGGQTTDIFSGSKRITSLSLSPSADKLAVGDISGHVRVINTSSGEIISTIYAQKARISKLDFSPDGKFLASSTWAGFGKKSGNTMLFKTNNFEEDPIILEHHKTWVRTASFSQDSRSIAVGCQDSIIRIYPVYASDMASNICSKIDRNLSKDEWQKYVSDVDDIPYEKVCADYPLGDNIKEEETKIYQEKLKAQLMDANKEEEDE